jgi:TrmH family RNA methyltransferase
MITSKSNPKIQRVRTLITRRQARAEQSAFVAEGVRLVEEALQTGWPAELILFSPDLSERGFAILNGYAQRGAEVEEVAPDLLKSLSDTETPQGILAVLAMRSTPLPPELDFALILDQLRDPGNLGTILRSASAAGVQAVFTTPGTTDPYSPKALRAGMGAHFHLPVLPVALDELSRRIYAAEPPLQVLLADAGSPNMPWTLDLRRPTALVIGGEAEGASAGLRELAHGAVSIPMPGQAESLNAAIAASILLYEVTRQRSVTP